MASAGVSKLRFMTKARETSSTPMDVDAVPGAKDRWSLTTFDSAMLYKDPSEGKKLTSINVTARRSYGGANPYVEQQMIALERTRKKRKI